MVDQRAPGASVAEDHRELIRFIEVMRTLRRECPWDAEQTHRSLVPYLVEESLETVEAIEAGDATDLQEELGDLLLQVVFHANIAAEAGEEPFTLEDVARGVADKLVSRHPYVFGDGDVPDDLHGSWEARKVIEKGRTSVLEGVPDQLSALSRATKIISRARARAVPVELPTEPIEAETIGNEAMALVARAHASGVDAEQAVRDALRALEARIVAAEAHPDA